MVKMIRVWAESRGKLTYFFFFRCTNGCQECIDVTNFVSRHCNFEKISGEKRKVMNTRELKNINSTRAIS